MEIKDINSWHLMDSSLNTYKLSDGWVLLYFYLFFIFGYYHIESSIILTKIYSVLIKNMPGSKLRNIVIR